MDQDVPPSGSSSRVTTPASSSVAKISSARVASAAFSSAGCADSSTRRCTRAQASPPCSTSASTIECVTFIRGRSGSGTAATSRSKVCLFQPTNPSGGFLVLILRAFLGSPPALASARRVLDVVLGGLGDDVALGVKAGTPRAAHDLVKLAGVEVAHAPSVKLGERGEHHGVNRHVDAHAERVRAADDRQQALLRELLHQKTVARQHARVVHAYATAQQALERLAKGGGEARALDGVLDLLALLLGGDAVAGQALRAGEGGVLRKVHDVERRLPGAQRQLDGALERRVYELVGERHRPRGVPRSCPRCGRRCARRAPRRWWWCPPVWRS